MIEFRHFSKSDKRFNTSLSLCITDSSFDSLNEIQTPDLLPNLVDNKLFNPKMDEQFNLMKAIEELNYSDDYFEPLEIDLNQLSDNTSNNNNSEPISTSSMSTIDTTNQRVFTSCVYERYTYAERNVSYDSEVSQTSTESDLINQFSPQPQNMSQVIPLSPQPQSSSNQPNIASTYMLLNQEPRHRLNTNGYFDVSNRETGTRPKTRYSFDGTSEPIGLPSETALPSFETLIGRHNLDFDPTRCEPQSSQFRYGHNGNRSSTINIPPTPVIASYMNYPNRSLPSYSYPCMFSHPKESVSEPSLLNMSEVAYPQSFTNRFTRRGKITPSRKLKVLENEQSQLENKNLNLKETVRDMEKRRSQYLALLENMKGFYNI